MEVDIRNIPVPPKLEDQEEYYQLAQKEKSPSVRSEDQTGFNKWAVPNNHAKPKIVYEFVNESGVTSIFEGTWRNDGFGGDGNAYSFQYKILSNKFEFRDLLNEYACYGFFTFNGDEITFSEIKSGSSWSQKYKLSDAYLDLQIGTEGNIYGRFFRQDN